MTENGKSQIQTVAAAMLGFVLIVGVGALTLMSRGGSAKAPSQASHPSSIPVAPPSAPMPPAASSLPDQQAGEAEEYASSPAPVLPSVMKEALPAAAPPRPAALVVTQHLEATQTTSAKATVAAAPAAKPAALPKQGREFVTPKLVAPRNGSIASSVHYGVSSRSELMGRAAGPVYNFKGRGAKKTAPADSKIGGQATTQIKEAQEQVEKSALDEKAKKDLSEQFQLINDGIGQTGSN